MFFFDRAHDPRENFEYLIDFQKGGEENTSVPARGVEQPGSSSGS